MCRSKIHWFFWVTQTCLHQPDPLNRAVPQKKLKKDSVVSVHPLLEAPLKLQVCMEEQSPLKITRPTVLYIFLIIFFYSLSNILYLSSLNF